MAQRPVPPGPPRDRVADAFVDFVQRRYEAMHEPSLTGIVGRTVAIYVLMLVVIRILGKRTVGNLTAFDMLIALIMGDLAGTAIYGEAPLWGALAAVTTLAALHYANSWLTW